MNIKYNKELVLKIISVVLLILSISYVFGAFDSDEKKLQEIIMRQDSRSQIFIREAYENKNKINKEIKELEYNNNLLTECIQFNKDREGKIDAPLSCNLEELIILDSKKQESNTGTLNNTGSLSTLTGAIESTSTGYVWRVNSDGDSQPKFTLTSSGTQARINQLLFKFGRYDDVKFNRWKRVADKYKVDQALLVCIAKADTLLGTMLKTKNNIGNVGNTDSGNIVHLDTPIQGIDLIGKTLVNKYLGYKQTVGSLSKGGGGTGSLYATSPENWNANVLNCLNVIYNTNTINENWVFRK